MLSLIHLWLGITLVFELYILLYNKFEKKKLKIKKHSKITVSDIKVVVQFLFHKNVKSYSIVGKSWVLVEVVMSFSIVF